MSMHSVQATPSTRVTEPALMVAVAIAFWTIGRWLSDGVISVIQAAMGRSSVDPADASVRFEAAVARPPNVVAG